MRILRSVAVWIMAIGLLGSTAVMLAQNGSGNGNGNGNGSGSGQHNGGMNGGMSGSQGGAQSGGMGQPGSGSSQMGGGISSPGSMSQPGIPSIGGTSLDDASTTGNPRTDEEMSKLRSNERQKKLIADTERLLSLANELKADMDKTNKDTLSLDVVRKADEIEKLAHSVKERMKGA